MGVCRAARAVSAGAEEFVQHVVFVGGYNQLPDRQPHHAGNMTGAHVAEVARRHAEADGFVIAAGGGKVALEVIHHLRHHACPVDRIHRADLVAGLEGVVVLHRLDDVLAIVKHPAHGEIVDVGIHQAVHLRLLERAHQAVRAQHEHVDAGLATHGVFGGAAGVAGRGAEDVEGFATAGQYVFEHMAKELHGHVLEGKGRAVGEFQDRQPRLQFLERGDVGAAEHLGAVGGKHQALQVVSGNVVGEQADDFKRQRRVIKATPGIKGGAVDLRVVLGQG